MIIYHNKPVNCTHIRYGPGTFFLNISRRVISRDRTTVTLKDIDRFYKVCQMYRFNQCRFGMNFNIFNGII